MSTELRTRISDAMKDAMRAREKERLGAIRLIQAEFKRIEVDERIEVDDERALAVLDKMLKQRRDSRSQYEGAGREDLAAVERFEMGVIQGFLPAQLTDAELGLIVDKAIADSGAESMRDMGKAMGLIKPQVAGRADMGDVSKLLKAKLG
ncbi:GatB/YqeY domain-containing protein [Simiduia sp. 21SJ11W-1]|uniref:GatB/YqeY domain-containing protein n=1 Tax=Simiduia sp. 21SJ11W-1 TaxID=2909669 RepID=UPI0020A1D337|nr:GatB/YqeY domain-containing protein [Simiduia sp. 21SJ11W-1]UTA47501.1 GatB/YqeY domain-containing protein [Simiduia sp. 21SJ11W-1]